ncbi:MAG: T9SS type A sorting domain-containing protein [Bacteroidetes bacterium]|nr:T9SS type A sorting domain-containing protein [Bacteroidota bacterium]
MKSYRGLLFFLFLSFFSIYQYGQGAFSKIFSADLNGTINCIYNDTINNRTFIGGGFTTVNGFTRNYIACFNSTTGALLPFDPGIANAYGNSVTAITSIGNDVYYTGSFNTVSGQARAGLACSDFSTNALKTWTVNVTGVSCLAAQGNLIYLAGYFTSVNGVTRNDFAAVNTSGVLQPLNPNINSFLGGVTKMYIVNNNIYVLGNGISSVNGIARNGIAKFDKSSGVVNSWNPNMNAAPNDFVVYKNLVYAVGDYTSVATSSVTGLVALDTISGALVHSFPNSSYTYSTTCATTIPVKIFNCLAVLSDTIFFTGQLQGGGYYYEVLSTNISFSSLKHDFNYLCAGIYTPYTFLNAYNSNFAYEFPIKFLATKNILSVDIATESCFSCHNNYQGYSSSQYWKIYNYCLLPKLPTSFAVSTSTVCARTYSVPYSIPLTDYVTSYAWSYSGTGVTINANNNSATLDFGPSATSGTLSLQLVSSCDATVRKVSKYITVNPLPVLNAGPDITLNCANNKVNTLNGNVSTGGTTYAWNGPLSYYSNILNPTLVNSPQGNYVLSSTITATGCSWRDTAYVTVDTITPSLTMPVLSTTKLSCGTPALNLNASTGTPGAVITWTNSNNTSHSNPWGVSISSPTVPTSYTTYSVTVINPSNGCTRSNTLALTLDTIHPTTGLSVTSGASQISCISTTASLSGSSGVSKAKLYWNGPGLGVNTPNPATANSPGTYTLMARDTTNGCQSYINYTVLADTAKPVINPIVNPKYLTCDTPQVTLNATSPSVNTTFVWQQPSGPNIPNPSFVTNAGVYTVVATDVNNGCTRSRNITVVADTAKPNLTTNVDSVQLSCSVLSYSLNANTSASPATISWSGPGAYSSANPATVTTQGFYTVLIKNTFNGCLNSKQVKISIDSTKPYIVPFTNNYQINCSVSTTTLNGTTIPSNKFVLSWTGPASFSSGNPAAAGSAGSYTFTALDTATGCQSVKYVNVNYLPNLIVHAGNDTIICYGSSAQLQAQPVGGTPSFTYTWSHGATGTPVSVSPLDTTHYIVTIQDAAGCSGKDTVTVLVPAPVQDSAKTFLPCDPNLPLGQIQVYGYGGVQPYTYAIGSSSFQTSNNFANLAFGTYTLHVLDNLGCSTTSTATIDNSSLRPEPNFLVTTNMFASDTFVVVDISNPRPDSVQWTFPPNCQVIDNSNPFSPVIVNSDTGSFVINLKAFFGSCEMNKSKTVHIGSIDTTLANSTNNNGIQNIILYPNPNSGQFNVEVSLYKKQTFAILIYDANGIEQYRQTVNEGDYINQAINMTSAGSGSYVLKVVAEYDSKQKPFIISQ